MKTDKRKTLYVSDMDGTLLNSSSTLSTTTTKKLNGLISRGAMFTVATARTPATVVGLMKDVNSKLPFIVMAGCAMWNNTTEEYASARLHDSDNVNKLMNIFNAYGNNPFIYYKNGNQIIVEHTNRLSESEKEFIAPRVKTWLKQLKTVEHLSYDPSMDGVMLIFSMGKFADLRTIADQIDKEGIECTYNCYHDIFNKEDGFIDIYDNGITKASAIQRLAKETSANRIVVFGDNLNDIPMMKCADVSIAVENAFSEVKECADIIIGSNDDDSVAKWIEQDFESEEK